MDWGKEKQPFQGVSVSNNNAGEFQWLDVLSLQYISFGRGCGIKPILYGPQVQVHLVPLVPLRVRSDITC